MPGVTIIRPEKLTREPVNHSVAASKMVLIPPQVVSPLVQFAQAWFSKGDRVERHFHDGITEVFFLVSGGATSLGPGGEPVRPGDSVLVPPGAEHGFEFTEASHMVYFAIVS